MSIYNSHVNLLNAKKYKEITQILRILMKSARLNNKRVFAFDDKNQLMNFIDLKREYFCVK